MRWDDRKEESISNTVTSILIPCINVKRIALQTLVASDRHLILKSSAAVDTDTV